MNPDSLPGAFIQGYSLKGEGMLFYKLQELADKWGKTIDDILQMVLDDKMKWWVQKPELFFSTGPLIEDFDIFEPVLAKVFMMRKSKYFENYYGTGEPCKYYLEDFVVFPGEVARVEAKYPDLSKSTQTAHEAGSAHPKSGSPKAPLTEAVTKIYEDLHESGNIEAIMPGRIELFMEYLKGYTTEGNSNESDYVQERIKEVKKISGKWIIFMQSLTDKQIVKRSTTGKNETFGKPYVSRILSALRKELPLPS